MIRTALDQCTDSKLYVAMNLSFACSLRMGEILGLTWNNVHISDDDIADDNAYVFCSFLQMNMISKTNVTGYTAHACDYYQVTADLDIN